MSSSFHLSLLLKMITDRVDALITRELAIQGITAAQGRVLAFMVARGGQRVTQKDIERHLGVSHTTAKGLVERLERKGMLTAAFDNEDDGRLKSVYMTDKSRAIHRDIARRIDAIENTLLGGLSPEERAQLMRFTERLYANIQ